ncbi:MAG: pilus assembly protein N-terminal domain-containing protein [Proteobacteria bacterium]|nr:pilus assembly protein N-terminal domain-containing protein [Pseudomonadota bacterium]
MAALLGHSALMPSAAAQDDGLFPPRASVSEGAPEYELSPTEDTHPMMRLTPEKSEIVNLDADVKSLIVGNPMHLNIIMDNTRRLVLIPRTPGATHFTALDDTGKVVMQRHVIVSGPNEKFVRIRRSCAMAQGGNCEDTSMYYCPGGMCHPVAVIDANTQLPRNPVPASVPPGGASKNTSLGSLLGNDEGTSADADEDANATRQQAVDDLLKALKDAVSQPSESSDGGEE